MFEFGPAPLWYHRSGLFLLLAQFSLFLFGLPPFQSGIWYESEPILEAIFIFAVLNSAWLAFGLTRGLLAVSAPRPLMACLLLWAAWQLTVTSLAGSYWRSWFGPAELGEGTGRTFALLLLTMLACPLWQVVRYRPFILYGAALNIALQSLFGLLGPTDYTVDTLAGTWVPSHFTVHVAFMAGNLWIAVMCSGIIRRLPQVTLLSLFTLAALCLSFNKSAIILMTAAITITGVAVLTARRPDIFHLLQAGKKSRLLAILACLLPMAWIAVAADYSNVISHIHNVSLLNMLESRDSSIGSRLSLGQVAVSTLQHEPNRWFTGGGWGRFTDDLFKYALVPGVHAYHNGIEAPNWSLLDGTAFHSHSQPLEVLLSLGLPGLLLWFAFPVIALITLPRPLFWPCAPMLVALTLLYYFWFEMPQCLAYDALLLAALITSCRSTAQLPRKTVPSLALVAMTGLAMLWSVYQQTQALTYSQQIASATQEGKSYRNYTPDWLASDARRGGDRLYAASIAYATKLAHQKTVTDNDRGWYALLMEATHIVALSPAAGPRLASTELWLQYTLLLDLSPMKGFAGLEQQALLSMPGSVLALCRKAPLRDDIASTFLINLPYVTHNDKVKQDGILNNILAIAPNHRPALLLIGKLMASQKGHEAQGKTFIRYAASLGVENVYPVTDRQLQAYAIAH